MVKVGEIIDYTQIPIELDHKFGKLGRENTLKPSIIHLHNTWTKTRQASLLSQPTTRSDFFFSFFSFFLCLFSYFLSYFLFGQYSLVREEEQRTERNEAFDLLDALTKSGELSIRSASLHVVIASTHCFDKTLIDTIVQDNVNPIEKVEKSSLMIASTIHDLPIAELVNESQIERLRTHSAISFEE